MIELLRADDWKDYELIDSGQFEKLERFGTHIISRPEPQAVWKKSLSETDWAQRAAAIFKKDKQSSDKGDWIFKKGTQEQWMIGYQHQQLQLKFRLGFTSFKHLGLFPEQSENWKYIFHTIKDNKYQSMPKVLNLFAYTGGASLAAKAAGADVTHVDSVKQVIHWGKENMMSSGLEDIRWVVEDALKFVKREAKRGHLYEGIILDPPAYGRGPDGEKWLLEEMIDELISHCMQILHPTNSFIVFNMYSMGLSYLIMDNLVTRYRSNPVHKQMGELYVEDGFHNKLPLGTYWRAKF